eukprot:2018845-Amphidinium_carterae.1
MLHNGLCTHQAAIRPHRVTDDSHVDSSMAWDQVRLVLFAMLQLAPDVIRKGYLFWKAVI